MSGKGKVKKQFDDSKVKRKDLIRAVNQMAAKLQEKEKFIQDHCTTKGEVTRMFVTLKVATIEALGDEAWPKVLEKIRELVPKEVHPHKEEAIELFGEDLETPKPLRQIGDRDVGA